MHPSFIRVVRAKTILRHKAIFRAHEVSVGGVRTLFRLFEPPDLSGPLPVILFLHGAGESGSDGVAQTRVGIGPAIRKNPGRFPALIIFPQASRGYGWRDFNLEAALAALQEVESAYRTDRDRVYVTGISMGGFGTWLLAIQQPERFAAVVPVCGGLDQAGAAHMGLLDPSAPLSVFDQAAQRLTVLRHWVFHGGADRIVPAEESRTMVAALRRAGADVRYTEYRAVRHNSWDRAYAEAELIPWLFEQRRSS